MNTTHLAPASKLPIAIDVTIRFDDKLADTTIAERLGRPDLVVRKGYPDKDGQPDYDNPVMGVDNWEPLWDEVGKLVDSLDRDTLIELIRSGVKLRIDGE
jgi:hypothetical protein